MAGQLKFKNNKKLGNTGLYVSELCLGTMIFQKKSGNVGRKFVEEFILLIIKLAFGLPSCDEETSFSIMNSYAEMGGNFLDTANIYADSEEVIGK